MALITCPECGKEISDKAYSCPHCGYPLKETENKEYVLSVGNAYSESDGFALFLNVCGGICLVGGLIISYLGAKTDVGRSSQFSFSTFLTLLSPFLLNSVTLFGMASVVNRIKEIYGMVRGIRLDTKQQTKDAKTGKVKRINDTIPRFPDDWKCSHCGTYNSKGTSLCKKCSKFREV